MWRFTTRIWTVLSWRKQSCTNGPARNRVVVQRFDGQQSAADNAAAVVSCALENFEQVRFNGADPRQTVHRHAEFYSWLFGLRRGLQPLGMSSRARPKSGVPYAHDKDRFTVGDGWNGDEIEPMPVLV